MWNEWTPCNTECTKTRQRNCFESQVEKNKNGCTKVGLNIEITDCEKVPAKGVSTKCWQPRKDFLNTNLETCKMKDGLNARIFNGIEATSLKEDGKSWPFIVRLLFTNKEK